MKEVQQLGEPGSDTDVDLGSSVLGEAIQSKKPAFSFLPNDEEVLVGRPWSEESLKAATMSSYETAT